MLDKTIIDSAVNKKFTEFSDAVRAELHSKLGMHDTIVNYTTEYDRIQTLKSKFAEINNPSEE